MAKTLSLSVDDRTKINRKFDFLFDHYDNNDLIDDWERWSNATKLGFDVRVYMNSFFPKKKKKL